VQCLLPLAVGKGDMKHPAVAFEHHQGIELTGGFAVCDGLKVPPVDLHLFTGRRFKPAVGPSGHYPLDPGQTIPDNGDLARKSFTPKMPQQDRRLDVGVGGDDLVDHLPEWIELRWPTGPPCRRRLGLIEIFCHAVTVDVQLPGDLPRRQSQVP
jgi:hypothetical protein